MILIARVTRSPKANDDLVITKARIKETGNITEMVGMTNQSSDAQIIKLSADEYMVKSSGEVKKYNHSENRMQNLKNVRVTITNLRDLINTNIVNAAFCKWITLTYAENMTDNKRLTSDFASFWKRFRRWLDKNKIPVPEYISVIEPQARGAWHVHLILIWRCEAPFLDNNSVIQVLWGHGFTKTKALNNVDNIGAYFSAYLADMPLDELEELNNEDVELIKSRCETIEKTFEDEAHNLKNKKFVKGARLFFYPPGMNLYRASQGLRKPLVYSISPKQYHSVVNTYSHGKKKSQFGELTFSTYAVVSDSGKVINAINRYYFNTNKSELNGELKNGFCERMQDLLG